MGEGEVFGGRGGGGEKRAVGAAALGGGVVGLGGRGGGLAGDALAANLGQAKPSLAIRAFEGGRRSLGARLEVKLHLLGFADGLGGDGGAEGAEALRGGMGRCGDAFADPAGKGVNGKIAGFRAKELRLGTVDVAEVMR